MDYKKWQYEKNAMIMAEALEKKGYIVYLASDLTEARQKLLELIPEQATVGLGGSITLEEMDVLDSFRSQRYRLIDRYQECSSQQHIQLYKEAMLADYFITSANAVTQNGEIVCTDCSGNRVAAMIFGPDKVIIVVGANKLVANLEEAFVRIKKIAPMNAKRNHHATPCVQSGQCEACNQAESMCNYTGIIHTGMKVKGRITVIVIAEAAGL